MKRNHGLYIEEKLMQKFKKYCDDNAYNPALRIAKLIEDDIIRNGKP